MMQSEQIDQLVTALVASQMEFPVIDKTESADIPTKNGGSYSYKYADIAAVAEKINPIINKHGLAISQEPTVHESGQPSLTTTLLHVSGQWRSSEMLLQIGGEVGAQAQGSAITYARRYAKCAVLDLVTDSDDDGAAATQHGSGRSSDGLREPSGPRAVEIGVILQAASLAPDNTFLNDIAGKWHKWGKLSDKQIDVAHEQAFSITAMADSMKPAITGEDSARQADVIRSIKELTDAQKEILSSLWDAEQLPSIKKGLNAEQLGKAEGLVGKAQGKVTERPPFNPQFDEEPF